MNYQDFRQTYKWSVSHYPGTSSLFGCDGDFIRVQTVKYSRPTSSGKWIETDREIELVGAEYYMNTLDAVPFFRRLGGFERVEMNYTKAGYIPVQITSISPDKTEKIVRKFIFG